MGIGLGIIPRTYAAAPSEAGLNLREAKVLLSLTIFALQKSNYEPWRPCTIDRFDLLEANRTFD